MTRFGPYDIEGRLGRGGMGEVFRARDREQGGRPVAIKVLPAGLSQDPQYEARFRREAEHAARLSEPHIPAIHRYGEIEGRLFLDMELVPGRGLDVLVAGGPLAPALAVGIIAQVAAALDHAHHAGLVHRDVKPSNVLVDERSGGHLFARLIDFGIATAVDPGSRTALTRTGAVIGTLAYMAPERFLARPAGPAADVYALACVLFELLTGQRPYPETGVEALLGAHVQRDVPRPSSVRAGLPGGLDAVIACGMAKDPEARFATAGALAIAAQAALHTAPARPAPGAEVPKPAIAALPALGDEPAARRRRPWWLLPAGSGVTMGAAIVVAVLMAGSTGAGFAPAPVAAPAAATNDTTKDTTPSTQPIVDRTFVAAAPTIEPVKTAVIGDRPVLVTQGKGKVLDLATGQQLGTATGDHATVVGVDGAPQLLFASYNDSVIRIADLATGTPTARTLTGHTASVFSMTAGVVDGRTVVASSAYDKTVRFWDLADGRQRGAAVPVDQELTLQFTQVRGRPAVVGSGSNALWVWDAATGAPIGAPIPIKGSYSYGPVVATIGGRTLAVAPKAASGVDKNGVITHDLAAGAPPSEVIISSSDYGAPVAIAEVAGRTVLLRGDGRDIVQYDPTTGTPVGSRYVGHEADVTSLSVITADGKPYLLSSSDDHSVRIWDMTARNT